MIVDGSQMRSSAIALVGPGATGGTTLRRHQVGE